MATHSSFLLENPRGRRSLVGSCRLWDRKESVRLKQLNSSRGIQHPSFNRKNFPKSNYDGKKVNYSHALKSCLKAMC